LFNKMEFNGKSLFLFSETSLFRKLCGYIVYFRYFDSFILFMILVSTILLTLDNPLDDPKGPKHTLLLQLDILLTLIFTLECALKIIVYGFLINGKKSYLRSAWNVLDFFIVIIAIISLITTDIELNVLKVLRLLRILRPLKMISKNPNLKIAVQSLINAIPGILNVMIITFLILALFSILSVQFFKGTLFYCTEISHYSFDFQ